MPAGGKGTGETLTKPISAGKALRPHLNQLPPPGSPLGRSCPSLLPLPHLHFPKPPGHSLRALDQESLSLGLTLNPS